MGYSRSPRVNIYTETDRVINGEVMFGQQAIVTNWSRGITAFIIEMPPAESGSYLSCFVTFYFNFASLSLGYKVYYLEFLSLLINYYALAEY